MYLPGLPSFLALACVQSGGLRATSQRCPQPAASPPATATMAPSPRKRTVVTPTLPALDVAALPPVGDKAGAVRPRESSTSIEAADRAAAAFCSTIAQQQPADGDADPAIVRFAPADFQDVCDAANLFFAEHPRRPRFGREPCQVYNPANMHMHFGVREPTTGKILALVNMIPRTWTVGGTELKVAGIGGVCSHPVLSRGKGYVQRLVWHCIDLMKQEGYHMSQLDGIRQRYAYYGYDKCGAVTTYEINRTNVRRYFAAVGADMRGDEASSAPGVRAPPMPVRFVPIAATAKGGPLLAKVQAMQRASPAFFERGDDFALLCGDDLHAALDASDKFVGYLVGSDSTISEIEAATSQAAVGMIAAWALERGAAQGRIHGDKDGHFTISVKLAPWQAKAGLGVALGRFAEDVQTSADENWKVLDWASALSTTLALRAATGKRRLGPGKVVVQLTDVVQLLTLTVDEHGVTSVSSVSGDRSVSDTVDVRTDSMTAMRVFWGPTAPEAVLEGKDEDESEALEVLSQWCPLPLYTPSSDSV